MENFYSNKLIDLVCKIKPDCSYYSLTRSANVCYPHIRRIMIELQIKDFVLIKMCGRVRKVRLTEKGKRLQLICWQYKELIK